MNVFRVYNEAYYCNILQIKTSERFLCNVFLSYRITLNGFIIIAFRVIENSHKIVIIFGDKYSSGMPSICSYVDIQMIIWNIPDSITKFHIGVNHYHVPATWPLSVQFVSNLRNKKQRFRHFWIASLPRTQIQYKS